MDRKHKSLMRRWENTCIICGESFVNEDSVTREHIIPASKGGSNSSENMAVSHYMCNQLRGDMSIIDAAVMMSLRKQELGDNFIHFVNIPVPHRYPYEEKGNPLYGKKPVKSQVKKVSKNVDTGKNPSLGIQEGSNADCGC